MAPERNRFESGKWEKQQHQIFTQQHQFFTPFWIAVSTFFWGWEGVPWIDEFLPMAFQILLTIRVVFSWQSQCGTRALALLAMSIGAKHRQNIMTSLPNRTALVSVDVFQGFWWFGQFDTVILWSCREFKSWWLRRRWSAKRNTCDSWRENKNFKVTGDNWP